MAESNLCPSAAELAAIRTGNEVTFSALLERWSPDLEKIAGSFSQYPADFDGLLQVGRITLYQLCCQLSPIGLDKFDHLVRWIVKRRMVSFLRRQLAKSRSAEVTWPPENLRNMRDKTVGPAEILLKKEEHQALEQWLNRLEGKDRIVLDLIYWVFD
jgi:RNA polymerase sigma factor (sigma-70 family)